MDEKIKDWLSDAKKLADEIITWTKEGKPVSVEQYPELSDPEFYLRKSELKSTLDKKYSWERFIADRRRKRLKRRLVITGYAASIMLIMGVGFGLYLNLKDTGEVVSEVIFEPGSSKALLIMEDGEEVFLAGEFLMMGQDGTVIRGGDSGELVYETGDAKSAGMRMHTLRTMRGGEYSLILPDGTKVWLNSESELVYPMAFGTEVREVSLKGEAYFDIAKDSGRRFFVNSGNIRICATGTEFNVSAYEDEREISVTLIQGGVNIEGDNGIVAQLTPNDRFSMNTSSGDYRVDKIDPRTAMSWKEGYFFFDDETLSSIARKLQRWYNVDVIISTDEIAGYRFSGRPRRYESADKLLDMLEMTREIRYAVTEENKIVIYPYK